MLVHNMFITVGTFYLRSFFLSNISLFGTYITLITPIEVDYQSILIKGIDLLSIYFDKSTSIKLLIMLLPVSI